MFSDRVLNILLADNPWLEEDDDLDWVNRHLPNNYIDRDVRIELDKRVGLIIGPRQAGKSTLIWKTISNINRPVLFVNCEEPAIRDGVQSPALFIRDLGQLVPGNTIVFFEEVQQLVDAGLFLKGLVDRKTQYGFLATGSSSYELESKTRESLAGRANRHLLLPLSLLELSDNTAKDALKVRQVQRVTQHLLIYGGYPTVFLGDKKEVLLTGLVESFIIRDASDRFRIKHTEAFRKLLELMASQIGNLCNYSNWAANTGISADTVRDYSAILSDAHIVRLVRPFVGGKRAEITSTPKVYFLDNGIRNRLFGGFASFDERPDKGVLFENFVFIELYKNINPLIDSIHFWRSKSGAEVDFVVRMGGKLVAIEVKAGKTFGKLSRSAHSFITAYSPEQFWVVSQHEHPSFMKNKTEVLFIMPSMINQFLKHN